MHESTRAWAWSQNRAHRQTGRQAEERLGAGRAVGGGGGALLPEDVSDCLAGLGQCTGLEEPGGQEGQVQIGVKLS